MATGSGRGPSDPVAEADGLPLAAEDYLTYLAAERGRAPRTIAAYRRDLRRYQAFLAGCGVEIASADTAHIVAFVQSLRDEGLAPASVARTTAAVRGLHRFMASEGHAPADPSADVEGLRVPRGLPRALTEQEVLRLLDAVVDDTPVARRDRAILEVLYGCGLRISELCGLSLGDVDVHGALVRVLGKGSKERIVPLGRCAADALTAWLDPKGRHAMEPRQWRRRGDAEAVFLNHRGGRLSRQGAWGVVRRRAEQVGLSAGLSPHVLRHSCATHMLDHGADIRSVQEMLGHASISTTQIYTRVSTEWLADVYRRAHPRARWP